MDKVTVVVVVPGLTLPSTNTLPFKLPLPVNVPDLLTLTALPVAVCPATANVPALMLVDPV